MRRTIDALDPPRAIQGVQSAVGPAPIGAKHGMDSLLEMLLVQRRDLSKTDAGATAVRAILHRPPQFAVARKHGAGRPRRSLIDKHRIGWMRRPTTEHRP